MFLQTTGGLGNQLFQWAFAHHISKRTPRRRVVVFKDRYHSSNRRNLLELFPAECSHGITFKQMDFLGNIFRLVDKFPKLQVLPGVNWASKLGIKTTENSIEIPGKTWLYRGYFQKPNYFWDAIESCAIELESVLHKLESKELHPEEYQVIHIRRTDYLNNMPTYGVLSREYYESVIDSSLDLVIVGDELSLPQHFSNLGKNQKYFGPNELDELQTLALIRSAKLFVMANSTFSWWAGVLAVRANIRTIMPAPWQPNISGHELNISSSLISMQEAKFEKSNN